MTGHSGTERLQGYGIAVLRVVVGTIFLAHGTQKLLEFGVGGTAAFFSQVGVPLSPSRPYS